MKKTFLKTALAAACFITCLSPRSFASSHKTVNDPEGKVTKAIHQDFPRAQQITWTPEGKNFMATFSMYESRVTVVYDREGELLSTLILSSGKNLPFEIQTKLSQKYPDYEIRCVKEYIDHKGSNYFFILKKQEGDQVTWLNIKSNKRGGFDTLQKLNQHA